MHVKGGSPPLHKHSAHYHKSVFDEGECERNSVVANFATTAKEGGVK